MEEIAQEEALTPQTLPVVIREELITFNVTKDVIDHFKSEFLILRVNGVDDKEGYKKVKESRILVKNTRVKIDHREDELLLPAKVYTAKVKEEAGKITKELKAIETHLQIEQDRIDVEIEKRKAEEKAKAKKRLDDRVRALQALGAQVVVSELDEMSDEDYLLMLDKATKAWHDELHRLQAEKEAQEKAKVEALALRDKTMRRISLLQSVGMIRPYQEVEGMTDENFDGVYSERKTVFEEEKKVAEEKERKFLESQERFNDRTKLLVSAGVIASPEDYKNLSDEDFHTKYIELVEERRQKIAKFDEDQKRLAALEEEKKQQKAAVESPPAQLIINDLAPIKDQFPTLELCWAEIQRCYDEISALHGLEKVISESNGEA